MQQPMGCARNDTHMFLGKRILSLQQQWGAVALLPHKGTCTDQELADISPSQSNILV